MTLFTGFGGADLGMSAAGIEMVAGIENDLAIAEVAQRNGISVTVVNILDVDPTDYIGIDCIHASPPCPNFSLAKTGRAETRHDIALAQAVCRFLETLKPKIFTLENVWAYRWSHSWRIIEDTLHLLGYLPDMQLVNSADMGVPQTRKRMIVRAIRGEFVPELPAPVPWVGWYEAIKDLIPTLPESRFAPWQLARLPEELKTMLVNTNQSGDEGENIQVNLDREPAFTITQSSNGRLRAFLMPGSGNTNFEEAIPGKGCRYQGEPAQTVTTITKDGGGFPRAFLVHPTDQRTMPVVEYDEPIFTVVSNGKQPRDFLVDGQNGRPNSSPTLRDESEPSYAVTNQDKGLSRAWLSQGHVVKMTPRALARFQSFPDWYALPANNALACKGIGNAIPSLMMQKIYEGLLP